MKRRTFLKAIGIAVSCPNLPSQGYVMGVDLARGESRSVFTIACKGSSAKSPVTYQCYAEYDGLLKKLPLPITVMTVNAETMAIEHLTVERMFKKPE